MDPEKFDKVVLDLLYDELDELTHASATRHIEQSTQARAVYSELRAVREIGQLPLVEPPEALEDGILRAERETRAARPLKHRLGSFVSVLAGYAMRPQLAMAALLMLMIGASLIFLRARPGDHSSVQVTERGVPESENESVAIVPVPEPEAQQDEQAHGVLRAWREPDESEAEERKDESTASAEDEAPSDDGAGESGSLVAALDEAQSHGAGAAGRARSKRSEATAAPGDAGRDPFGEAMLAYTNNRYSEARDRFDAVAASGGPNAATAALFAARAAQRSEGCDAAIKRYERVSTDHTGTGVAREAQWLAARCYGNLGQTERARQRYEALVVVPHYRDKARAAIAELDEAGAKGEDTAGRPAAAAKAAAPPASAPSPSKK